MALGDILKTQMVERSPLSRVSCASCFLSSNFKDASSSLLIDGVLERVHDSTVHQQQVGSVIGSDQVQGQPTPRAAFKLRESSRAEGVIGGSRPRFGDDPGRCAPELCVTLRYTQLSNRWVISARSHITNQPIVLCVLEPFKYGEIDPMFYATGAEVAARRGRSTSGMLLLCNLSESTSQAIIAQPLVDSQSICWYRPLGSGSSDSLDTSNSQQYNTQAGLTRKRIRPQPLPKLPSQLHDHQRLQNRTLRRA